jgi:hypothetical protein
LRNAGKSAARRVAVLLAGAVILSGCSDPPPVLFAVKAVAAGVPSLDPFFDEGEGLGRDQRDIEPPKPHSGLQQGNTPGLYGGTQQPTICDVDKLEDFLTDPDNKQKAQVWANIVGIRVDDIGEYLDGLTPVLLRHDTLVKNHDYKKGKGVPFDALLEAGIAVLVDKQGLPAVKCSCGNPLRAFDKDPERVDVQFKDGNDKWEGYKQSSTVVVKPAPQRLKEIKLVDVEDPNQGISRDVGTTGESDQTFDTRERQEVPEVSGMAFGQASAAMAAKGLAVTVLGGGMPPSDAVVTGSDPGPGTELRFGDAVALTVEWPEESSDSGGSTEPEGSESGSGPGSGSGSASGSTTTDPESPDPSETGGLSSPGGSESSETDPTPGDTDSSSGTGSPTDDGDTSPGPSESSGPGQSPSPRPSPTQSQTRTPTQSPTSKPPIETPTPTPTTSSAPPPGPDPDPTPSQTTDPPTLDPTTSDPDPPSDPPADPPSEDTGDPGDPGDPGGPGGDPGDPVEDPAQPVWI